MRKEENKSLQSTTETDSGSQIAEQAAGPAQKQGESTPSSATSAPANPSAQERGESTPSSAKSAPANPPAQEQEQERGESTSRSARAIHEILDSKQVADILRSQFKDLVKHIKERENVRGDGKVLELLRQEFGKDTKEFLDVCRVKNWMKRSESVCHIINISDDLVGTGFLLFDRFILTNKHLIKDLNARIYVSFHYENEHLPQKTRLPIKEVIDWAYEWDEEKCWLDYALLELSVSTADLPPPLLTQYGPPIQCGGLCIIGHPESGVKRVDFCSIIDLTQVTIGHTGSVIENEILRWINWNLSIVEENQMIAYHTCFFHGASGSPVFDKYGQVVAMHTAGFRESSTRSAVEYAIPLLPILEHFLSKMAGVRRLDILRRFIEVAMTQDALRPLIAGYIQLVADSPEPMETS
ncbi:serine protease FAM111A-like [Anguilla rostrata]|uniref:serine protease FAM111A-like n=1 Tax=Anguilla rostrata TaxID=7938 RepID=UPI0030D14074